MTLGIGIIGIGHWGPNLARNFYENPATRLEMICDLSAEKASKILKYGTKFTTDPGEVTARDNGVDAVVIATPLSTHFELAREALRNGKHLLVEKPAAATSGEVRELIRLSESAGVTFMVGHVFLYNNGIRHIRKLIEAGELGRILFIHGQRTNLGPVRRDADALWDLTTHDIAICNYLLDSRPEAASAIGSCLLNPGMADVVSSSFLYPDGVKCEFLASWLHPCKVRQLTVVGDRKMLLWDDMQPTAPIRLYDKNITRGRQGEQIDGTLAEFQFHIQDGEATLPAVTAGEPLRAECAHFVECVLNHARPLSNGQNALEVIAALEAATDSMRNRAVITPVSY